jgi:hypothetical protein
MSLFNIHIQLLNVLSNNNISSIITLIISPLLKFLFKLFSNESKSVIKNVCILG